MGIGERDHALSRRGPDETTLLEPFGIKRHADAVVPDDLDQRSRPPSEHEQVAAMC